MGSLARRTVTAALGISIGPSRSPYPNLLRFRKPNLPPRTFLIALHHLDELTHACLRGTRLYARLRAAGISLRESRKSGLSGARPADKPDLRGDAIT